MYKKAMSCLLLMNLLFLFGFLSVWGIAENKASAATAFEVKPDKAFIADSEVTVVEIMPIAASGQRVENLYKLEKKLAYNLSEEDRNVLMRIVEAEAGGEDIEGKLLVANVVLNRVNSKQFPDTVRDVVFQRGNGVTQFSPVADGRYETVEISEETEDAVWRAMKGEDISQGALYFAARERADSDRMKWFDENLTFLFKHGGHEFFK